MFLGNIFYYIFVCCIFIFWVVLLVIILLWFFFISSFNYFSVLSMLWSPAPKKSLNPVNYVYKRKPRSSKLVRPVIKDKSLYGHNNLEGPLYPEMDLSMYDNDIKGKEVSEVKGLINMDRYSRVQKNQSLGIGSINKELFKSFEDRFSYYREKMFFIYECDIHSKIRHPRDLPGFPRYSYHLFGLKRWERVKNGIINTLLLCLNYKYNIYGHYFYFGNFSNYKKFLKLNTKCFCLPGRDYIELHRLRLDNFKTVLSLYLNGLWVSDSYFIRHISYYKGLLFTRKLMINPDLVVERTLEDSIKVWEKVSGIKVKMDFFGFVFYNLKLWVSFVTFSMYSIRRVNNHLFSTKRWMKKRVTNSRLHNRPDTDYRMTPKMTPMTRYKAAFKKKSP